MLLRLINLYPSHLVITARVAVIQPPLVEACNLHKQNMDYRDKPGNDDIGGTH